MAGHGQFFTGLFRRRRSNTVAGEARSKTTAAEQLVKVRPQQGGGSDSNGRRLSLSDPTRRRNIPPSHTGMSRGLLDKLKIRLSFSPDLPRIYSSGKSYNELPRKELAFFNRDILASYSGPDGGLTNNGSNHVGNGHAVTSSSTDPHGNGVQKNDNCNRVDHQHNGLAARWKTRNNKAYGMSLSLYEYVDKDSGKCTGEPIADVFAIRTTSNSCIMALADGVGWGQGARTAARCAVKGSMEYMWVTLRAKKTSFTTIDVFKCMRESLDRAQECILSQNGCLTTLCLAVVADIISEDTKSQKAVCVISVGDSLAFIRSQKHGVKEVTIASREYNTHRNIRFCDGALGPCVGEEPDLTNLTFSYTTAEEGDIVFLTSDGVSDNFDPVIARKAVANTDFKSRKSRAESIFGEDLWEAGSWSMPAISPMERQAGMTQSMEVIIRDSIIPSEDPFSASNLCSKLLDHVVKLTEQKRNAHEATNRIVGACESEKLDSSTVTTGKEALYRLSRNLPGKLDHATVVAYVVGHPSSPESEGQPQASRRSIEMMVEGDFMQHIPSNQFDLHGGNPQSGGLFSLMD
ncbi:PP2C-like domain-containing protein CG9801 [Asterias amurensis]|uniref:PP2C-like domain-containing protein CG9801 n=1 Tax=Asterias amurensis TaxID=7602 RepID=UPI003AB29A5E